MTEEEFQSWVPWAIYQSLIAAGMQGAILQDDEHSYLAYVANELRGLPQEEICEQLVCKIRQIEPYNPAKHFN